MKKSTWIILGLVAVLGLVYVVTKKDKISVGVKHLELPTFDQAKVDRVEITGKGPIVLVRENDGWMLEIGNGDKPRRVKADQSAVAEMLHAVAGVGHSYYVTELEEKLPDLGLSADAATTVKLVSEGKPVWSLMLGKNDADSGRYAKLPEHKQVYVVRGSFWQIIKDKLDDWRDHNIWQVPQAELASFDINRAGKPYIALKRSEDGQSWSLDKTKLSLADSFRADQAALDNLVRAGLNLRASGFIDEHKELSAPELIIEAKTKDAKEYSLHIFAGGGENYWLKNIAGDQLFEVSKRDLDRMLKPIEELRSLTLMSIDKNAISKVVLATNKGKVVVEKSEGQWKISEPSKLPEGFEFDPATLDNLLSTIAELKGDRLAHVSKDKPSNANWQKVPLVELSDKEGKKIGFYATKSKAKPEEYLAQGNIDQEIYIVRGSKLRQLEKELDAFKKEEFELPPIDENTKGFESLPVDIQRKLLDATKEKK